MRPFVIALLVLAFTYIATAGAARMLQRRLIFHPDDRHPVPSSGDPWAEGDFCRSAGLS